MNKKGLSLIFLTCSFILGFSISAVRASPPMPEIVTCYYAETSGTGGYYRCESGQSCTWYDNKDPYMKHVSGECLRNPGEEVLN